MNNNSINFIKNISSIFKKYSFRKTANLSVIPSIFLIIFLSIFLITASLSPEIYAQNETKKEIEFWTINLKSKYEDYFLEKIEIYEAENQDIKIQWEDLSFYSVKQKLNYRIAEGDVPEVVNLSPELMSSLLHENKLFAVSDLNEDYTKKYFPELWEAGKYKDKIYAFPWYFSSRVMIYNKEIFKIAGLEPAKPLESYEELFRAAAIISEKTALNVFTSRIKIHQEFIKEGINLFTEVDGKTAAAFNTQKALEIIREYTELFKKGIISNDSLRTGFNIALQRYKDNKNAVLFTSPIFLDNIENTSEYLHDMTAVSVVPKRSSGFINASLMNLVIPKSADYIEESADFAAFITSSEAQLEFSQISGVLPSAAADYSSIYNTDKAEVKTYNEVNTLSLRKRAEILLYSQLDKAVDMTLMQKNSGEIIKVMDEQFARAAAAKITPEEALDIMEAEVNKILRRNHE